MFHPPNQERERERERKLVNLIYAHTPKHNSSFFPATWKPQGPTDEEAAHASPEVNRQMC